MNRQKMIVGAAVFLAVGLGWMMSFWNGTMGFSAAHPVAGSKFSMNIAVSGWPALGGVALTATGLLLLLVAAVMSIVDLAASART